MKQNKKSTRTQFREEIRAIHKDFVQSIEQETGKQITYEKHRSFNIHYDEK